MSSSETDSDLSRYDPEDDLNAYGSTVYVSPNTEQADNVLTNVHAQDSRTQVHLDY